jgi:hypothetical protein
MDIILVSVPDPDPDPDPPDPLVLCLPDTDSDPLVRGMDPDPDTGNFYHQAKIVKKTLIPTVLWLLLDFLPLKIDVNVPSKGNKQKNFLNKNLLFVAVLKVNDENSRIRIH